MTEAGGKARRHILLIAGPTASGKSSLALALAERLGAVIVNADSMQVYSELRILTARPTGEDEARAPHRLYGHVPSAEGYTVARYLADVGHLMTTLPPGQPLVLVGGTGLYFNALTQGLSEIPPVNDEVRAFWRRRAEIDGAKVLHRELRLCDPKLHERLNPNDTQRVLRALEVYDSTGRPLSDWQAERSSPLVPAAKALGVVIAPDRSLLHLRIEERFGAMVAQGALEEARQIEALQLPADLPVMKAIGLPEMIAAAGGHLSLDDAVAAAVTATRQYAKRQETWFRNQMKDWLRIPAPDQGNILSLVGEITQQMK